MLCRHGAGPINSVVPESLSAIFNWIGKKFVLDFRPKLKDFQINQFHKVAFCFNQLNFRGTQIIISSVTYFDKLSVWPQTFNLIIIL